MFADIAARCPSRGRRREAPRRLAKVCGRSIPATSLPLTQRSSEETVTVLCESAGWAVCTCPVRGANSRQGNSAVKKVAGDDSWPDSHAWRYDRRRMGAGPEHLYPLGIRTGQVCWFEPPCACGGRRPDTAARRRGVGAVAARGPVSNGGGAVNDRPHVPGRNVDIERRDI